MARVAQPGEKMQPGETATWRQKVMEEFYEEKDPDRKNRPVSVPTYVQKQDVLHDVASPRGNCLCPFCLVARANAQETTPISPHTHPPTTALHTNVWEGTPIYVGVCYMF